MSGRVWFLWLLLYAALVLCIGMEHYFGNNYGKGLAVAFTAQTLFVYVVWRTIKDDTGY